MIVEGIELSLSYKDGSITASDFALSFGQQLEYFLLGGIGITYTEKFQSMTFITNIMKLFNKVTVEFIEIFEGALSPLFISLKLTENMILI